MSTGILMRDLARMARDGEGQLIGRPVTDTNVLAEVAFRDKHGMTRADMAARNAQWKRDAAEESVMQDYRGPIPGDVVGDFRGLRGPRLEWARFGAWRDRTAAELTELESTKARLADIVQAPAQTESRIVAAVKKTARLLLGTGTDDDSGELTTWTNSWRPSVTVPRPLRRLSRKWRRKSRPRKNSTASYWTVLASFCVPQ